MQLQNFYTENINIPYNAGTISFLKREICGQVLQLILRHFPFGLEKNSFLKEK